MSMRRLRRAFRAGTRNAGLLVLCGAIGLFELLALFLVAFLAIRAGLVNPAPLVLYRPLLVVGIAAILPGCYAVYREGVELRAMPRRAASALRSDGPRLVAASVLTRLVATVLTAAGFALLLALLLGVDTLAVWSEALLGLGVDRTLTFQLGLLAAGLLAAWLVNGLVAYQDLLVIDGESSVLGAWKDSTVAVLSAPRWYVWQALTRGLLLATPWALAIVTVLGLDAVGVPDQWPGSLPAILLSAAVFVGVTAVARATLVAYHVETMESIVGPAAQAAPTPIRNNLGRVAMAAILVLSLVGGVAAVRAGDVTPGPDLPGATLDPDDPAATMEVAIRRTTYQSHAKTERSEQYNATAARWDQTTVIDGQVDRDRGALHAHIRFDGGGQSLEQTVYGTDGVAAARGDGAGTYATGGIQIRAIREPWVAFIGHSFDELAREWRSLEPADARAGWTLRSANESTLVYAITDPADFHDLRLGVYTPPPTEEGITYRTDSEVLAVLDRDRGTIERVVKQAYFEDRFGDEVEVRNLRSTITYRNVGNVTVDRPDSLGGPGPLEILWDVVYYA